MQGTFVVIKEPDSDWDKPDSYKTTQNKGKFYWHIVPQYLKDVNS